MGQELEKRKRSLKFGIQTLFALLFLPIALSASEGEDSKDGQHGGGEAYDAGKSIMEHVKDGYSIHFFTVNKGTEDEWHASIPLPIITWTDKGVDVFMSSKLHHGHAIHKTGGYPYGLDQDGNINNLADTIRTFAPDKKLTLASKYLKKEDTTEYYAILESSGDTVHEQLQPMTVLSDHGKKFLGTSGPLSDLSITRDVAGMFFVLLLMCLMFFPVAKAYKKRKNAAPKGWQGLMEPLILFIRDEVAKPNIGEERYRRFMPFLLTVFFFILIANIAGLMPFLGGFNVTGNIGIIAVLAGMVLLVTNGIANKEYWKHIFAMPGVPVFLYPIMVPIELVQIISKPFVLMVRLTANMTAGHIIILSFAALIMMFGQDSAATGYGVSVGSVLFMVFMNTLKLLISFIQAYVFVLLSAIYFGSAIEEAH